MALLRAAHGFGCGTADGRLMTASANEPRRVSVERNIYRRPTGVLEIGFKDASGIQRWRTVDGGIMAARKLRDELLARRGRGETVAPDSRLRFGEAAELWLAGPVLDLRATTQAGYRSAVEQHLRPPLWKPQARQHHALMSLRRWSGTCASKARARRRSPRCSARSAGSTSSPRAGSASSGVNPTTLMLPSERPKVSLAKRCRSSLPSRSSRRSPRPAEPYRTLFTVAALTGARMSELCGLTWADVHLDELDDAEITFGFAGRPARQPAADQDRRVRPHRADPARAGAGPRAAQARLA